MNKKREKVVYKAQCVECPAHWPNKKTLKPKSRESMRAWRVRHQLQTGHTMRSAATFVDVYVVGGKKA